MEPISSEHLARAERALASRAAAAASTTQLNEAIAERSGLSADLVASFVEQHYGTAKKKYFPGVDPRVEQFIITLMRHCLLTGALAGKISEGRD